MKVKEMRGLRGGSLELDLYNEFLKLAIEHNGLQHYKPVKFGNQTKLEAVEQFQRHLSNQHRTHIGDFADTDEAVAPLNRELHCPIHS